MEEAQFESLLDLLKTLMVCVWGQAVDIFVSTRQQMEYLKRPDQQRKNRLAPACWI
jgi:uncharacterized protein (DUF2384 family)